MTHDKSMSPAEQKITQLRAIQQPDYKADRIRLEKMLDDRMRFIDVTQDGADFFFCFELANGKKESHIMTYPHTVTDYDMKAAKEARGWFIAEFMKRYPAMTPIFDYKE